MAGEENLTDLNREVRLSQFDRRWNDGNEGFLGPPYVTRKPRAGGGRRQGFLESDSRTDPTSTVAESILATSKYLASAKGLVYSFKQQQLQKNNPVEETRIYDPTAPVRTAAFGLDGAPAAGITRHAGEGLRGFIERLGTKIEQTRFGQVTGELWKQAPSWSKDLGAIGVGAAFQGNLVSTATAARVAAVGAEQGAEAVQDRFLGGQSYDPKGGPDSEGEELYDKYHPGNPYIDDQGEFADNYTSLKERREEAGTETPYGPLEEPEPRTFDVPTIARRGGGTDLGAPSHGDKDPDTGDKLSRIDVINNLPPMKGEDLFREDFGGHKDVVPFRIFDIHNDTLLVFRSFVDGISDSPSPSWNQHDYTGRPEKAHTYSGYENSLSFSLKITAFSPEELRAMWRKVNYLKGLTAPSYYASAPGGGGYMVPPFLRLTLGDLYTGIYGYMSSLSLSFSDEAGWEIDPEIGRLPKMVEASIDWQVIERRRPQARQQFFDAPFLEPFEEYSGFEAPPENDPPRQ